MTSSELQLSKGSLDEYLRLGREPPTERAIFQLVTSRPINAASHHPVDDPDHSHRLRIILSDGVHCCSQVMFVLNDKVPVPKDKSIVQVVLGSPNVVKEVKDSYVWVVYNFKVLRHGGSKVGNPKPLKLTVLAAAAEAKNLNESTPDKPFGSGCGSGEGTPGKRPRPSPSSSSSGISYSSVKRALFQDEPTHPIKALTPFQNRFRIKARAVQKSPIRNWSNSRGEGKVFDVVLQDASGSIKVAAFNDVADRFHDTFEPGRVYALESVTIKPVQNRKFNATDHDYELTLHNGSKVQRCSEDDDVPAAAAGYRFKSVAQIYELPVSERVDLAGVAVLVGNVEPVTTRAGRTTQKRDVRIADDSGEIAASLWADQADKLNGDDCLHKVVMIRGATVTDWKGKSLNLGFWSDVVVEPKGCEKTEQLKVWFASSHRPTVTPSSGGQPQRISTIGDVKTSDCSWTTFTIEASIASLKLDSLTYKACPKCRKKVTETGPTFWCEKCDEKHPVCDVRYVLQATLVDVTDHHNVTVFDEAGEKMLGIKAKDLTSLQLEDPFKYRRVVESCKFRLFKFNVGSKRETWNNEMRLKLSVLSVDAVDRTDPDRLARLRGDVARLQSEFGLADHGPTTT